MIDAILCDIDGTIAEKGDRSPYDWDKVGQDTPKQVIINLINHLSKTYAIVLISGRDSVCMRQTQIWLIRHKVKYHNLYMRKEGDNRKDTIIKQEIYERDIKPKYHVQFVLDDRNQVVEMWRELGLTCLQVADGDF